MALLRPTDPPPRSKNRHVLTPEETARGLAKARSPEGRAAQVEARKRNAQERRQVIAALRNWGMVIGRIAMELGMADATVEKIIRELEAEGLVEKRPRYGRGLIESKQ